MMGLLSCSGMGFSFSVTRRYLPMGSKRKEKVAEKRLRVIAEDLRESLMELTSELEDPQPRKWAHRCAKIARA